MWNFNLLQATRSVETTMPFLLYRLAVCLGVALASLLAALIGSGTLIAFASFSANPAGVANVGALMGLAALSFILYRFRGSFFFHIKAGHLALLAELARGEKLPQGKLQIDLAKQKATARFPSAADFFELGRASRAVLKDLSARRCAFLGRLANRSIADILGKMAEFLAQSSSQALLALCFLDGKGNTWQSVRAGLGLHVRHFDSLSRDRLYLLAFEYLGLVIAYMAMLYPVDSAVALLPVDVGVWRYVFALIFAWSLKAAFLEPIATSALAQLYFDLSRQEGETTEQELQELGDYSETFRRLGEKAA